MKNKKLDGKLFESESGIRIGPFYAALDKSLFITKKLDKQIFKNQSFLQSSSFNIYFFLCPTKF